VSQPLNSLEAKFDDLSNAIIHLNEYSYQYNTILIGISVLKSQESSMETTTLCIQLFKEMGVAVKLEDIDIAHRVPDRKPSMYKPIICEFSRRIVKEQVISCRRNVNKINPKNVGLAAGAHLSEARVYDHLPPDLQNLLFEAKKFQLQYATNFVGLKIPLFF
jgi:hypothetical protein